MYLDSISPKASDPLHLRAAKDAREKHGVCLPVVDQVDERAVTSEVEDVLVVAHPPGEEGGGGGRVGPVLVDLDLRLVDALAH